ncbi:alginate lyase family protein [uncultured Bacteroides sp.]|uniref:alginate lyase family protein n=1 Tax=uncultured Bacteroides sp. TaxID=162156 RepID=UPI002637560E|nr:alginate lyase family protein [uncultured Bacteroides sp.]
MKKIFITCSVAFISLLNVACQKNEFGTVDLTIPEDVYTPVAAQYTFNHPCGMFNQADFDRVKSMLDDGTAPQPVKEEFQLLKNSRYTMVPYTPSPTEYIVRGDATGVTSDGKENYSKAMNDAAAAYQMALLWKLTDDTEYADNAVNIMNKWADECKGIKSNDANQMLAAGAQGYTFANAAEIMRTYDGWSDTDFEDFKKWMVDVFASKNIDFMTNHQGQCDDHYWSNWDLVNMCSYFSIGVLTENHEMINYVVNYFYSGAGNGCIKKLVQGVFDDPLGTGEQIAQNQESGRDQGHASMSVAVTANLCQMAYTLYQSNQNVPELDFFSANDNLMMKMSEYTALFNLKNGTDNNNASGQWLVTQADMPFNEYKYCIDCSCTNKNHGATQSVVADDEGRGKFRPGWEIYYMHYSKIKKLGSGYTYAKKFADKIRPEGGVDGNSRYGTDSGAFDQLGWCTLMMYRE